MGGLILPFGFPAMSAQGTEGFGVGVDPVTLSVVAPNSESFPSQAALDAAVVEDLTNGDSGFALGG
jgi:hypothetical protein